MSRVILRAHAKINLNLKVVGRRPDGFHDIESIVQTITLHDTLTLEEAQGGAIELSVRPPLVTGDPDNLVWQAWETLSARLGSNSRRGVRLLLEKRIPIGAGLGGGSSDAAAVLIGLDRLWRLGLSPAEMHTLAAPLGSDVPFFLTGGTARLRGRGDVVEPLPDLLGYALVLVYPGLPISTRAAYSQVQVPLTPRGETGSMPAFEPAAHGAVDGWVRLGNDLEPGALDVCPAIMTIKRWLVKAGARSAAMSGSGSSVFGTFEDPETADRVARERRDPGWTIMRCQPLSRKEYRRSLGLA